MKENETSEVKNGSILVPFLAGGILGAAIALLLAPKSGRDLRQDITDIAADTRDKVNATIDRSKELYDEGRSAVKNAIEAGKTAYVEEREKRHQAA